MIAFDWLPPSPSNLDRDLMAPAGRPYWRSFWPFDQRPTLRDGVGARGLSIKPLLATKAQEYTSQLIGMRWLSHGLKARGLTSDEP